MADRPTGPSAHSTDPSGSIPQPKRPDGEHIKVRADFNDKLPTTENPPAPVVSEQVKNTQPIHVLRPDGVTYNAGAAEPHIAGKEKDDKAAAQANAKAESLGKQETKGKAYVSPQVMARLKQINRDSLNRDRNREQERGR